MCGEGGCEEERGDSAGVRKRLPVSKESAGRLLSSDCRGHARCRAIMHYKDLHLNRDSADHRFYGLNQAIKMLKEVHTVPRSSRKGLSRGRHGSRLQSS